MELEFRATLELDLMACRDKMAIPSKAYGGSLGFREFSMLIFAYGSLAVIDVTSPVAGYIGLVYAFLLQIPPVPFLTITHPTRIYASFSAMLFSIILSHSAGWGVPAENYLPSLFALILSAEVSRLRNSGVARRDGQRHGSLCVGNSVMLPISDFSNDAFIVRDLEGVVLEWSKGAERLYGYSASEVIGTNCDRLIELNHTEDLRATARALTITCGKWAGNLDQRTRDGRSLRVATRCVFMNEFGRHRIIVTNTDVTAVEQMQLRLTETESRYRSIFDSNSIALIEMDFSDVSRNPLDGSNKLLLDSVMIVDCNRAALHLLRLSHKSEALGPLARWLACEPQSIASLLEAAKTRAERFEGELVMLLPDGVKLTVSFHASFSTGLLSDRFVVAILEVTQDPRRQGGERWAMHGATDKARNAAVSAFAASIIHEINQPLAALMMNVSASLRWINRRAPDLSAAETAAIRARQEGERVKAILERAKTRIETERTKIIGYSLRDLVEATVKALSDDLKESGAAVVADLPSDFPEISGDPVGLQQVLVNLINNAVEATEAGGDRTISIKVEMQGIQHFSIKVSDHGTGFSQSDQRKIFEPFFTTKASGMGMGLAICASIIADAGGSLRANNNHGRGATFEILLPLVVRE